MRRSRALLWALALACCCGALWALLWLCARALWLLSQWWFLLLLLWAVAAAQMAR